MSADRSPGDVAADALHRLRAICLALPGTSERLSHGAPAWWVADTRTFALFADHHRDDRLGVWLAAAAGRQGLLCEQDPTVFYRPPYLGHRGWLGVRLDRTVDWPGLADLLIDAHELVSDRLGRA